MAKTKLTQAQWDELMQGAGNNIEKDQLIELVFKDGPNALWDETVRQMHVMRDGMYNYLTGILPTRVWDDWNGSDELGRVYHSPYIPMDFSIFAKSMNVCDPGNASDCKTNYCSIPRGGVTNLPAMEMFKWGAKTDPICIASIRTNAQARDIAKMIVNERFAVDEQLMNTFYTLALIRMLGHKHVLEFESSDADGVRLIDNANPYNPIQGGRFNYMEPLFPAPGNLENIMPMDMHFLEVYGSALARMKDRNNVSTGPRGEPIYELWHADDWYRQEVLDNQEYIERVKYHSKIPILYGHRAGEFSDREVVGNFVLRQNDNLPRFSESTEGGLAMVQPYTTVNVDVGTRPIHSHREYSNAPFYLACVIGKDIGEILTRPAISTGIEDRPIMPIEGNGDWVYRNDYDKDFNEDLNMPHFRKRYEMGFKMKNPDAGRGFIFRAKKFRLKPITTCDLRPIFKITPAKATCDIVTIGCNDPRDHVGSNILDAGENAPRRIICSSVACGDATAKQHIITIKRESIDSISPDQAPLACECGDTVNVHIGDEDGDAIKIRTATILHYFRPNVVNPNPRYLVELASALAEGECVKYISCQDETNSEAVVVSCFDNSDDETIEEGTVKFILDSTIPCNVGANVELEYFDGDDVSLGTVIGTIAEVYPETMTYVISSAEEGFGCQMFEGQVTVKIICD